MSVKEKTKIKKAKPEKANPVSAFLWKDKNRRAKNFYFLLVVIVCCAAIGMGYITEKLDLMETGDDQIIAGENLGSTSEIIFEEEDLEIMQAIDSAGSLNDFLYQWANNGGELYSSKNVINILLVGLDSKDALKNGGRSDSMILVSLNKKTEKIAGMRIITNDVVNILSVAFSSAVTFLGISTSKTSTLFLINDILPSLS